MSKLLELKTIASDLAYQQELLKDIIAQHEGVQEIDAKIKELQEQRKALIAADEDITEMQEKVKDLTKDLKQAAKYVANGTSFKPALAVAFAKAISKGEKAVEDVKVKGNAFSYLENMESP